MKNIIDSDVSTDAARTKNTYDRGAFMHSVQPTFAVGQVPAAALAKQQRRDRGYHVTIIRPAEANRLIREGKKAGKDKEEIVQRLLERIEELPPPALHREVVQLERDFRRFWAIKADWQAAQDLRGSLGLEAEDLHVTVGIPDAQEEVRELLATTQRVALGHFTAMMRQRLVDSPDRAGSFYAYNSIELLLSALHGAEWEPCYHPGVVAPARSFWSPIPGTYGMVKLSDLPEGTEVTLRDPMKGPAHWDGKQKVYPVVRETRRLKPLLVPFTHLIAGSLEHGKDDGPQGVWTFVAGWISRPSNLDRCEGNVDRHGTVITRSQAISLGFDEAKIVKE